MARTCIFCPAQAQELDHAIPAWIPRYLNQTHLVLDHAQANNVTKRDKIPFASYKARIICDPCNRHFGLLEDRAKPLVTPMLDGAPIDHGEAAQAILAEWAFKMTCALLGVERKRRAVPQTQRFALRQRGIIPASTYIAVGKYTGGGIRIFAGRQRLIAGRGIPTDKTLSAYHAIAAFGQVVFKVFGVLKPPPEDTFRIPVGRLYRVWPPRDELIRWPPLWEIDDDGIDDLALFNPLVRR